MRHLSGRSACFAILLWAVSATGALGTRPGTLTAQVTPADSAAVLLDAAARFEREGRWEIAEAVYVLISERYGSTPAGIEARTRLAARPVDRLDRTSRIELQVFGTIYGMWLGVAVPVALGAEDPEAFGAGLLIGGPLGFFGSRAALRARPLSEGQARAISWGGIWGTWQGFGWARVLDIGQDEFCDDFSCYETGDDTQEIFASMIVGGLAGITAGAIIARNPIESGVSSGAQGGSIWGSVYGAMIAGIIDDDNGDAILITSLVAGNVGLVAGAALAGHYDMSRGRVRMINLGALLGGVAGLGVDLLISPEDDVTALTIPLVSSVAGLLIAAHASRDSDRTVEGVPEDLDTFLLGYEGGRLRLGTPLPMPTLLSMDDVNGRSTWRPGLTLELFRARF